MVSQLTFTSKYFFRKMTGDNNDEPRVQDKKQVKTQQFCISVFAV